jgi:hypothetical protein
MKTRRVILTIDTIMDIFKDYATENDIPITAMPLKLLFKPTDRGRLAIEAVSDEWAKDLPPLQLNFDLRKIYSVS